VGVGCGVVLSSAGVAGIGVAVRDSGAEGQDWASGTFCEDLSLAVDMLRRGPRPGSAMLTGNCGSGSRFLLDFPGGRPLRLGFGGSFATGVAVDAGSL